MYYNFPTPPYPQHHPQFRKKLEAGWERSLFSADSSSRYLRVVSDEGILDLPGIWRISERHLFTSTMQDPPQRTLYISAQSISEWQDRKSVV